MGKLFSALTKIVKYMWVIDLITYLVKSADNLFQHRESLKEAAKDLKGILGEITLTPENIRKTVEAVKLIRQAGGVDELHEFLTEAKALGVLTRIEDVVEPGISAELKERAKKALSKG